MLGGWIYWAAGGGIHLMSNSSVQEQSRRNMSIGNCLRFKTQVKICIGIEAFSAATLKKLQKEIIYSTVL
jgi:cell fate regulator YaaT (PSP1 superfamily)